MNPFKPYFILRPVQLLLRALRQFHQPDQATVVLPWGIPLHINPRKAIGRAIWRTGLYELAVTETLHRLMPEGGTAIDVGANIGYLTGLLAQRAGASGLIYACEPCPPTYQQLQANIRLIEHGLQNLAPIKSYPMGLSDHVGEATLILNSPGQVDSFEEDDGAPHIGQPSVGSETVTIQTTTLDELVGDRAIDVMKIDVEGHELAVLRGARNALHQRRIQHIVFEDHAGGDSEACQLLSRTGYQVHRIAWNNHGPMLLQPTAAAISHRHEAPNFLATLHPDVSSFFAAPGWRCLAKPGTPST